MAEIIRNDLDETSLQVFSYGLPVNREEAAIIARGNNPTTCCQANIITDAVKAMQAMDKTPLVMRSENINAQEFPYGARQTWEYSKCGYALTMNKFINDLKTDAKLHCISLPTYSIIKTIAISFDVRHGGNGSTPPFDVTDTGLTFKLGLRNGLVSASGSVGQVYVSAIIYRAEDCEVTAEHIKIGAVPLNEVKIGATIGKETELSSLPDADKIIRVDLICFAGNTTTFVPRTEELILQVAKLEADKEVDLRNIGLRLDCCYAVPCRADM